MDLIHPPGEETLFWPGEATGFALQQLHHAPAGRDFFHAASRYCAPEHGGIRLEAPIPWSAWHQTVEQRGPVDDPRQGGAP